MTPCPPHFTVYAPPDGPTSVGQCKKCLLVTVGNNEEPNAKDIYRRYPAETGIEGVMDERIVA